MLPNRPTTGWQGFGILSSMVVQSPTRNRLALPAFHHGDLNRANKSSRVLLNGRDRSCKCGSPIGVALQIAAYTKV